MIIPQPLKCVAAGLVVTHPPTYSLFGILIQLPGASLGQNK